MAGPMGHGPHAGNQKAKDFKGTLVRLSKYLKPYRVGLVVVAIAAITSVIFSIISPKIMAKITDELIRPILELVGGNPTPSPIDFSYIWNIVVILIALYVLSAAFSYLQQFIMAGVSQKVVYDLRRDIDEKLARLPLKFFDSHTHGELLSRFTNDVDNISSTISNSMTQLLTAVFTIIGILCIMISLNLLLTAVSLLSVLIIFLFTRVVTKRTRKMFSSQQKILGKLNGHIEESVSGANVVKAFCQEDEMIAQFDKSNEELRQVSTRALIWSGFLMPITNVLNNLTYVFLSIFSGILAVNGSIEIGMISSFLLYSKQFARPFISIADIYNNFQTAVAGAERMFEIMDEEPEPRDIKQALSIQNPKGDIELQHVVFGYSPDRPILKDISLSIPAGTKVAIVGPTGAGKTTIINLLTRLYDVNEGSILLDGHDLRDYRLKDLRRCFSIVLQDTALFAETIRNNISYGRENIPLEKIEEAAKIAGADAFIQRLPMGYDTVLVQGGAELSQGERQLLTIARAVLADAPILILDEATSSVDTVTEQKIRRAMLTITQGRTSFIIAHRLSTIRDSDLIILLKDGTIAEQGTHDELMTLNRQYAAMYRTQIGENI